MISLEKEENQKETKHYPADFWGSKAVNIMKYSSENFDTGSKNMEDNLSKKRNLYFKERWVWNKTIIHKNKTFVIPWLSRHLGKK